jgi:hypothetical protein
VVRVAQRLRIRLRLPPVHLAAEPFVLLRLRPALLRPHARLLFRQGDRPGHNRLRPARHGLGCWNLGLLSRRAPPAQGDRDGYPRGA